MRVSPSAGGAARSLASAVFYVDGEPLPDTADGFEVPHEYLALALGARVGTQSTPTLSTLRYRMFCVLPVAADGLGCRTPVPAQVRVLPARLTVSI